MAMRLINYWYQALTSPHGVKISTPYPMRAKQKLYRARAEAADEMLMCLSIIQPSEYELWIVRNDKEGPNQPEV